MKRREMIRQCTAAAAMLPAAGWAAQAAAPEAAAEKTELRMIAERAAWRDVPQMVKLDGRMRALVEAAALSALGARGALRASLDHALDAGVKPLDLREAIVQTSPYAGAARALDAEAVLREALAARGLSADLPPAGTVTDETRLEAGLEVQSRIFGGADGNRIRNMIAGLAEEERPLRHALLTGHCFGDFYTRTVLALAERELLTFAVLAALGGCDPQVRAHVGGNLAVGNIRGMLLDAIAVMCPWIGFPKTLNALDAVKAIAK